MKRAADGSDKSLTSSLQVEEYNENLGRRLGAHQLGCLPLLPDHSPRRPGRIDRKETPPLPWQDLFRESQTKNQTVERDTPGRVSKHEILSQYWLFESNLPTLRYVYRQRRAIAERFPPSPGDMHLPL